MRKAANGLVTIVEGEMNLDPFSSKLFIFCDKARTIIDQGQYSLSYFIYNFYTGN